MFRYRICVKMPTRAPAKKSPKATMNGTKRENSPGPGGDKNTDRKFPMKTTKPINTSMNAVNKQ